MRKLNEFGIFGDINKHKSPECHHGGAGSVKPWASEDSNIEASVIKEAKDRLRGAISMGYTCVDDRYACDVAFCDRVHQEGRTVTVSMMISWHTGICQIHPEHVLN